MKPLMLSALFVVVLPLLLVLGGIAMNRPAMFDPPGPGQRLVTYLTTNVAATDPESPFPELKPQTFSVAPAKLLNAVAAACQALGWRVVALEPAQGSLTAVVTSPLWRFKDDVQVQVRATAAGGSTLEVHSASRVGKGDLGANSRHVVDLVAQVRDDLAK